MRFCCGRFPTLHAIRNNVYPFCLSRVEVCFYAKKCQILPLEVTATLCVVVTENIYKNYVDMYDKQVNKYHRFIYLLRRGS
jgi:hypothetical protein